MPKSVKLMRRYWNGKQMSQKPTKDLKFEWAKMMLERFGVEPKAINKTASVEKIELTHKGYCEYIVKDSSDCILSEFNDLEWQFNQVLQEAKKANEAGMSRKQANRYFINLLLDQGLVEEEQIRTEDIECLELRRLSDIFRKIKLAS